jgi:hypothetical protein
MVRFPWLRSARLLAGAPIVSPSEPGPGPDARWSPFVSGGEADLERERFAGTFEDADFLAVAVRAEPLVVVAGSRGALGDPMPGEW